VEATATAATRGGTHSESKRARGTKQDMVIELVQNASCSSEHDSLAMMMMSRTLRMCFHEKNRICRVVIQVRTQLPRLVHKLVLCHNRTEAAPLQHSVHNTQRHGRTIRSGESDPCLPVLRRTDDENVAPPLLHVSVQQGLKRDAHSSTAAKSNIMVGMVFGAVTTTCPGWVEIRSA
jgi:hypothetical protein